MKRILTTTILATISAIVIVGCMPGLGTLKSTTYSVNFRAKYSVSLWKVERPEKATQRYGAQKVDTTVGNSKYRFAFEDDLVRILWLADSRNIAFSLENKTNHSIRIPWDEAAYVDENGRSHRVMHSGVKYNDKEKPQTPSIVVRKGSLEDIVLPTSYVSWFDGGRFMAGAWNEQPLLTDYEYNSYSNSKYSSSVKSTNN